MDKPTPTRIHVFRAGTHVTAAGESLEFTQADLAAAAAAYDPALHEAPLVVGHPKTDDPAYGWAKGLQLEGNDLYVLPHQVNPEFAQLVNSGAFSKRSLKWYRPTDPINPKPGVWYPQHIGFLGAMPPAIKGLKPVELAQSDNLVEVEFGQWEDRTVARLFRRMREWVISKFGQEAADQALDSYDIEQLADEAVRESVREQETAVLPAPVFSEAPVTIKEPTVTPEEKAAIEAENAKLKKQLADREAADKLAQAAAKKTQAVQFCESLIGEGKVLPAEKDSVVGLLVLAANAQPVEFGEGDGTVTDAPLGRLEGLLKALPKRVEFSEVATGKKLGADIDLDDANALAARAIEFQQSEAAAGRQVSISTAVKRITDQQ